MESRRMRTLLCYLGLIAALALSTAQGAQAQTASQVDVLTVKGAITPIVAAYIDRGITTAENDGSACLIIQLDTPGGSVQVTEEIVQSMKAAAVPIVVYVQPTGAKAASAGTFVTLAAHLAAMAPGTRIGAAHPVDMSGQEMTEEVMAKSVNDAVALVKGLAEPRGPEAVAWAESAVRESSSITEEEALERGVVDLVAKDIPTLLQELDGREVVINDQTVTLATEGARINELPMSSIEGFLHTITDPNIAFLLMTIGLNAIIFELSQPGGYLSGVIGGICLVLALFSLGVLSVNWTGLIFIALAFILLIADVKAPTHGILTVLGVVSFILGSMILFSSPFAQVSLQLVVAVALCTGAFFAFVIAKVVGIHRRRPITGIEGLLGQLAVARSDLDPSGTVFLKGELWQAEVSEGSVRRGEQVEITEVDGFRLKVRKVTGEPAPK
jgi:membrane-bound serine protease (ClpP class)